MNTATVWESTFCCQLRKTTVNNFHVMVYKRSDLKSKCYCLKKQNKTKNKQNNNNNNNYTVGGLLWNKHSMHSTWHDTLLKTIQKLLSSRMWIWPTHRWPRQCKRKHFVTGYAWQRWIAPWYTKHRMTMSIHNQVLTYISSFASRNTNLQEML